MLGGKSGVEAMLASGDTAVVRQALQSSWKAFFKGAAKENLEEMPTELATEILSALAKDPNADVSKVIGDFIQNAPEHGGGRWFVRRHWRSARRTGKQPASA